MTRDRRARLWGELNARPVLGDRRIVNANTVAREGTAFKEIGFVHNPETDQWSPPAVLARGESLNFSAGDAAENE